MSEENVEIVRAAYNAFGRGDLDAVSQLQAPTIEWQTSVEDPDAATHRGRVAVRRYIEGYMETFPGLRAGLEECVEAPGDRVLATVRYTGRARASGMDMDWRQWLVYTLKGRADCSMRGIFRPRPGPRSRRAVGVVLWTKSSYE